MKHSFFSKISLVILRIAFLIFFGFAGLLFFRQHGMIYHPRSYARGEAAAFQGPLVELKYRTGQGNQLSFYLPPKNAAAREPARLWVMFAGNASLALGWRRLVRDAPNQDDGFLLVDYPGYGGCEGSASPAAIEESAEKALQTLGVRLGIPQDVLERKLNALGHSIGCAAALEFSVRHPVGKVILIAPFTSLREMARRTVGFPFCYLLLHNFDNRARLAELSARVNPPVVLVAHGLNDEIIPAEMGRELVSENSRIASFVGVPGANHNTILVEAQPQIYGEMARR